MILSEIGTRGPTLFCVTLTHALAAAASTLDSAHDSIHVRRATPLLVGENIDTELLFAGLDKTDVSQHALILESTGKFGRDGGVRVQTSQGNELQDKSERS